MKERKQGLLGSLAREQGLHAGFVDEAGKQLDKRPRR
jgi:hypothetical protein